MTRITSLICKEELHCYSWVTLLPPQIFPLCLVYFTSSQWAPSSSRAWARMPQEARLQLQENFLTACALSSFGFSKGKHGRNKEDQLHILYFKKEPVEHYSAAHVCGMGYMEHL